MASVTFWLALVAVVYGFLIEPLVGRWQSLESEIVSQKDILKKDLRILEKRKIIEAAYVDIVKEAQSREPQGAVDIMTSVETLSRNDSCLLVNIKPLGIQKRGSWQEVSIEITAEANAQQFSKFLYDLESSKTGMLRIKHFSLNPESAKPGILKGVFILNRILLD
ncbi:MAG: hypothetical protein HY209_01155 [Candidatus Omnitrophica bacterium]|nr:hypothetical protein [Candidatus Omnitrophota bacterium]